MGDDAPMAIQQVRRVRPGASETTEQEAYVLSKGVRS